MRIQVHKCRNIEWVFPVLGWLIMICQGMMPWRKSSFSHMAIEFNGFFYDVSFSGFKKSSREDFLSRYKIVESHMFRDNISVTQFGDWVRDFHGMEYDFLQIYGLFTKAIRKVSVNTIGEDFMKMICSELPLHYIATFYGHKFIDSDDYDLHTTWDLIKRF